MPLLDLLHRQPPRLLHQVHEPEVARAEHDEVLVADVVLRAFLRRVLAGRLADGQADHRVLLVPARPAAELTELTRALDELLEAVAVALLEGGALRLTVVGEDDDLVRTGRVAARAVDAPELLVELPQRLERVRALEPGVVGDLVIARERRVHRGPAAHHVAEHAVDDQVAHDHAHRRAHERVEAASVASRLHVAADGAQSGRPLEDHLPREEHEHACDVEAVGEERAVAGVCLLLLLHPAHGQDHVVRLAREQVAATCASVP